MDQHLSITPGDHVAYLRHALELARQSPPQPTNFRVGAVLVDPACNAVLATGYTLELPGNTHAEQCCLQKLAAAHGVTEEGLPALDITALPAVLALYTTMEPCSFRMSGNLPCVQRILRLATTLVAKTPGSISRKVTVFVGITEPNTFVAHNTGRQTLEASGVEVVHVTGLEAEILAVATAGHTPGHINTEHLQKSASGGTQ